MDKKISNKNKCNDKNDVIKRDLILHRTKHADRKERYKRVNTAKKEKKERRKKRKLTGEKPQTPRTIENTREPDSTILNEDVSNDVKDEIIQDLGTDEFSNYFAAEYAPKVLITFSEKPVKRSRAFASQLCKIIPNCMRFPRNNMAIKSVIKQAIKKDFTDIMVINEDNFEPNGLLLIHLPNGPTAHFRLSNLCISNRRQVKEMTSHRPEVILNNFNTRLGQTVGRMLAALFHYKPEFKGRHAVTFHNQRDYIFFRHHRYKFIGGAPSLRELGPRFTLKLRSLQRGTFDSKFGEYEFLLAGKRHELETSRRRFFL